VQLSETSVGILAKTMYRQLQDYGCTRAQVIHIASELLSLLSEDVQRERAAAEAATREARKGSEP
jgi:hypothetical protein